ncbi:hypothetical protein HZR23_01005 [Serpentinicella alkaliphila]|uniref:Uncharacterized protein n=2 Tax=Serpentinicella alkaliphila TaxID=1734049 RepID=A0A4R2TLM8_9FIRM|nr:hypothetical protein [Serpentinicella alkaliphila]QUH24514.1 hypothetical protein HZR23_01005 [Serpentinicella alkaliphila]TCQ04600.1 hypothetical protein EDD79_10063 [Serpentinicella alkaliphila]
MSTFGFMPELGHKMAAYTELVISMLGFYGSAAIMLNAQFRRVFLPVGKPLGIFYKNRDTYTKAVA